MIELCATGVIEELSCFIEQFEIISKDLAFDTIRSEHCRPTQNTFRFLTLLCCHRKHPRKGRQEGVWGGGGGKQERSEKAEGKEGRG